jgi:cell division protein ZapA
LFLILGKAGEGMDDLDKSRVTVMIMGEEYILKGSSTPEQIHKAGQYVDKLMKSLSESNIQMSKHKIAILAALNIADELLKLKEGYHKLSGESGGDT